ncbi:MAG: histidine phosphatase family protein [Candidatus Omnitrophota bacterium]|nr:histidine phosphatase family protein [Candidatus Omnitrophota bacterium]MBU1929648.1 histidine phosphatase family protein [Candidatus Omnitrophota bacterium]MBU2035396.1 histidine phosphatase family protein [Candidatus Omnitrophota bacterium]MBU2221260.1 histidine phosphatase family protein [Candidatus Omnitrophota bacterium]MBU2258148.1 histidine phosphatase family protein [Candidatus Omnitrophota bacterium]
MPSRLFLIRHGSTDMNKQRRYCGFMDIGINSNGRMQVRRLKARLKSLTVDKVYSSDRKRAIQTAGIIFKGEEVGKVSGLREMHFGVFEGLTYQEILKKYPVIYKRWIDEPFNTIIPKGESLNIFQKRVVRAFKDIIAKHHDQEIAIVCHGGTISAFITYILKSRDFWKHIPDSASLSVLGAEDGKFKVEFFNDTRHLSGIKIDPVKFK